MRDPVLVVLVVLGVAWLVDWIVRQRQPRALPTKDDSPAMKETNPSKDPGPQLHRDWLKLQKRKRN